MSSKDKKTQPIKSLAVLCSGGDSPGMNCAVRAVVRTALGRGIDIYGVQKGYSGLLEGSFRKMDLSSVGNIIQRGGTILQTSRCPDFHQEDCRREAAHLLKRKDIDGLIVIGGDGSFNGANLFHKENGIPVCGIPGTIDNDISGTNYTIGFDTAVQTAIEAVDKIRDTASSHERTFIVEVMGRKSTAIAVHVGVCTGAENIVTPNDDVDFDQIAEDIKRGISRGKNSSIIVVAEGQTPGLAYKIQDKLSLEHQLPAHVCILGHIQRGGSPSAIDRFIASKMGYEAVIALANGESHCVTAFVNGMVDIVPMENCLEKQNEYELPYTELARALSI